LAVYTTDGIEVALLIHEGYVGFMPEDKAVKVDTGPMDADERFQSTHRVWPNPRLRFVAPCQPAAAPLGRPADGLYLYPGVR